MKNERRTRHISTSTVILRIPSHYLVLTIFTLKDQHIQKQSKDLEMSVSVTAILVSQKNEHERGRKKVQRKTHQSKFEFTSKEKVDSIGVIASSAVWTSNETLVS